ncbi:MAG: DUF5668 domain-containing protein [Terracidiphilus sp.]|jgi:hypothetical protein
MNRYIFIHRLRGPAILLLIGILALLHQMGVISHFWHLFWPLLLILIGVMLLAERAALMADGGYPPYPGAPGSGAPDASSPTGSGTGIASYPGQPTAIVPANPHRFGNDPEGGQS